MILILITISTVHSKTKPTLAVLDFEGYGISDFEVQTLTDRLRNYIARIGTYRLVERGAVEEVPKEQGFQQSGCTSDECIVEVGKLLGVQYMLGGSMGRNSEAIPKGSSKITTLRRKKTAKATCHMGTAPFPPYRYSLVLQKQVEKS